MSPSTTRLRRVLGPVTATAIVLGATLTVAAPASAASGTALSTLSVRASASTSAKVVGTIKKGAKVTFTCYVNGTSVTGPYGKSKMWLSVDGKKDRWVSEALVYTGTNAPTVPTCSTPTSSSSSLAKRVDEFVKKHQGKKVDYDGAYGAQCVDLFNFYNRDVVKAKRPAVSYASQLYDVYDSSKYTRVSASSAPKKGDVAIWAGALPYSGGAGHVAVVLGTSGSQLSVLTQNPGATKVATMSKAHLRGYLRPRS